MHAFIFLFKEEYNNYRDTLRGNYQDYFLGPLIAERNVAV
jgi:hypothetical protein